MKKCGNKNGLGNIFHRFLLQKRWEEAIHPPCNLSVIIMKNSPFFPRWPPRNLSHQHNFYRKSYITVILTRVSQKMLVGKERKNSTRTCNRQMRQFYVKRSNQKLNLFSNINACFFMEFFPFWTHHQYCYTFVRPSGQNNIAASFDQHRIREERETKEEEDE